MRPARRCEYCGRNIGSESPFAMNTGWLIARTRSSRAWFGSPQAQTASYCARRVSHVPDRRLGVGGRGVPRSVAVAAEDLEEEQEDVQRVEKDRRGEQRCAPDVLVAAQALEVERGQPGEDHEPADRVDE